VFAYRIVTSVELPPLALPAPAAPAVDIDTWEMPRRESEPSTY
jgi:hypothetical protein